MNKLELDAAKLRTAWKRGKERAAREGRRFTQKDLALRWDVTEGNVSHYLRGREVLNERWKLRFAQYIGESPLDIWPDFPYPELCSSGLDADAIEMALDYQALAAEDRAALRGLAGRLVKKTA